MLLRNMRGCFSAERRRYGSVRIASELTKRMSDTYNSAETTETEKEPCAWCGKPARMKCSLCESVYLCSEECMEKLHVTHKYVCGRMTPLVTDPNVSPSLGVGDPVWEAAHRGLRGEYYINKADGKVTMQRDYEPGEDRPDLFLILPALERQRVIEFLDVRSLCRMEQVMLNVYSSMAWFEALRGLYIPALSQWPHYTSAGKLTGLRWCMSRRVELRGVQIENWSYPSWIEKVVEGSEGREIRDKGKIFKTLCKNERWTDIACLLVESESIDANSVVAYMREALPLLSYASFFGRPDVVKALLQAGADVNKADNRGWTALMKTNMHGHTATVEVLLQAGADVDKVNDDGDTALIQASREGHTAIAELLLQAGADPDKATVRGNFHDTMAKILLQAGSDADRANSHGDTALMIASQKGHIAIAEALLQAGADVDKANSYGDTALMRASLHGHSDIVELLLQAGADVDMVNKGGATALMTAIGDGRTIDARVAALSARVMEARTKGRTATVEALLQAGADIDKADSHGLTALIRARRAHHSDIVKLLLQAGATDA